METLTIESRIFGTGRIVGVGMDWDGVLVFIALFPIYGRQQVRPSQELETV